MSLITASGLSKSYGSEDIFSGLNLSIPPQARIALVGENGIGKTTLLNLLADQESPTDGKIQRSNQLKIGYLPQKSQLNSDSTLWEEVLTAFDDLRELESELKEIETDMSRSKEDNQELMSRYGTLQTDFENRGGYTYQVKMRQVLAGLGFAPDDFHIPVNHLSGGQRTRALLSQILLSDTNLLIFDEPTNHLDIDAIRWLEGYLKNYPGGILLVSHDRYFIDQVCNQIWEMSRGGFEIYRGNYSSYLEQRQERWERQQEMFEAEKIRLENELDYIKRNIAGQRTNQAKGKLRRLSRRIQAIEQVGLQAIQGKSWARISQDVTTTTSYMNPQEAHQRIKALKNPVKQPQILSISLSTRKRGGDLVLRTSDLEIGYPDGDKPLFSVPEITLLRGECAALIGPNGAGKTTFLKTILGQLKPWSGIVKLGANLDVGYFAQAHQDLNEDHTVLEEIEKSGQFQSENAARGHLGSFLFSGDDVYKQIKILSGGERGRLALAKLSLTNANLLLLDEPTNHLDIPSQETLQAVLSAYPGTILLVSHDRYLINALSSQIWEIDINEENLIVFEGNYQSLQSSLQPDQIQDDDFSTDEQEILDSYKDQKSAKNKSLAAIRKRESRLIEVEDRISDLEAELQDIGNQLMDPPEDPEDVADLGKKYRDAQTELEILLGEWEGLLETNPHS
jgi:ATP-binding cassette subfamily F protein 3